MGLSRDYEKGKSGTMGDLIYRQSAIDALCEEPQVWSEEDEYGQGLNNQWHYDVNALKAVPSAQRWIPCSERLPDYNVPVLTWDSATYQVEKLIPCVIGDDGEPIFSEWWVSDEYDEDESLYYPNLRDGAAIAWMPLPEPYREDGDENV